MRSTRVVVVSDSTSRLGERWSQARSASSAARAVHRRQTAVGSVRRRTGPAALSTASAAWSPRLRGGATRRLMAAVRAVDIARGHQLASLGAGEQLGRSVPDVVGHDRDPDGQRPHDRQGERLPAARPDREAGPLERRVLVGTGCDDADPSTQPELLGEGDQGVGPASPSPTRSRVSPPSDRQRRLRLRGARGRAGRQAPAGPIATIRRRTRVVARCPGVARGRPPTGEAAGRATAGGSPGSGCPRPNRVRRSSAWASVSTTSASNASWLVGEPLGEPGGHRGHGRVLALRGSRQVVQVDSGDPGDQSGWSSPPGRGRPPGSRPGRRRRAPGRSASPASRRPAGRSMRPVAAAPPRRAGPGGRAARSGAGRCRPGTGRRRPACGPCAARWASLLIRTACVAQPAPSKARSRASQNWVSRPPSAFSSLKTKTAVCRPSAKGRWEITAAA